MAKKYSENLKLTIEDNDEFVGIETTANNFRKIDTAVGDIRAKLKSASGTAHVAISQNGSTVSADKSFSFIKAELANGNEVFVDLTVAGEEDGVILPLSKQTETEVWFSGFLSKTLWKVKATASGFEVFSFDCAEKNHTHELATSSKAGLLSAEDKKKLDGMIADGEKITVDSELSAGSTNPVQNKVITAALNSKAAGDHTHELATSSKAGLLSAEDKKKLDGMIADGEKITVDDDLSQTSENPVQNKVVTAALGTKANESHGHSISDITNLQNSLNGKANNSHGHSISDITNLQSTLDGKASTGHTHSGYSASGHGHSISDITNLQNTLDGKASASHTHSGYAASVHTHSGYATSDHTHSGYAAKSHSHTEYASSSHNHDSSYAAKSHGHTEYASRSHNHDSSYAAKSHGHSISDVTNLQTTLNNKAAANHKHGNTELWNGNHFLTSTASSTAQISLNGNISDQNIGVVLVFSPCTLDDSGNFENSIDYFYQTFFIPKAFIPSGSYKIMSFALHYEKYNLNGNKILKIYNNKIEGYITNSDAGTSNGITYNNKRFILRKVYGV